MTSLLVRVLRALGLDVVEGAQLVRAAQGAHQLLTTLVALRTRVDAFAAAVAAVRTDLMDKLNQILADLVAANETTNELAADVDALIDKLNALGTEDPRIAEIAAQAAALQTKLRGVADKYTPETVEEVADETAAEIKGE